jgi:hypothetical protein
MPPLTHVTTKGRDPWELVYLGTPINGRAILEHNSASLRTLWRSSNRDFEPRSTAPNIMEATLK